MNTLKSFIRGALHLFYPHTCTGCGTDILPDLEMLCSRCITQLPYTGFTSEAGNPVERIFTGRLTVSAASGELYFNKGTLVQHLIHQLKYKGNQDIGHYLGELMGYSLHQGKRFRDIDGLVPLPLYKDKEKKRGYNQAAAICSGIAAVTKLPVIDRAVTRQRFTETQTRKQRTERWENVADSFVINNPEALTGKHLLLVDDVITTGATLDACGNTLLQLPGTRLSVAVLACAGKD
jgi:ComF family protein